MRKLFYGLGAVAAVVTPVVAVVSCGSDSKVTSDVKATYDASTKTITVTFAGKVSLADLTNAVSGLAITDAEIQDQNHKVSVKFIDKNDATKTATVELVTAAEDTKADLADLIAIAADGSSEAWLADCFEN